MGGAEDVFGDFAGEAARLGLAPVDDPGRVLGRPVEAGGKILSNRVCALPMEGWDADPSGAPTPLTEMRWERYGASGAALVWGEAVAVSRSGRSHPEQLVLSEENLPGLEALARKVREARAREFGEEALRGMLLGVQLAHGGRFARPGPAPVFHDPWLDARTGLDSAVPLLTDGEIEGIVEEYVAAASRAARAGFEFVDVKLCHGYLGHEILCAKGRPGRYGGSLENRARFFFQVLEGIRRNVPGLAVTFRLSLFEPSWAPPGTKEASVPFGASPEDPWSPDLSEPLEFIRMAEKEGVTFFASSLGTPYTTPHLVRPAVHPAQGDPEPPEPWTAGAARHLEAARAVKEALPGMALVTGGLSALGRALPQAAAAAVEGGFTDLVGLGRGLLSCPDWPRRILEGGLPGPAETCVACSLCTSMARRGKPAGCYCLDPKYQGLDR